MNKRVDSGKREADNEHEAITMPSCINPYAHGKKAYASSVSKVFSVFIARFPLSTSRLALT